MGDVDDELPSVLEETSGDGGQRMWYAPTEGNFYLPMVGGDLAGDGHSGKPYAFLRRFSSRDEASAYLDGVYDAVNATDCKLAVVPPAKYRLVREQEADDDGA